jgi:hypothetical protein
MRWGIPELVVEAPEVEIGTAEFFAQDLSC